MSHQTKGFAQTERIPENFKIDLTDVEYVYEDDNKSRRVCLGKGSFATVYLVKQKHRKRFFALKVVGSKDRIE